MACASVAIALTHLPDAPAPTVPRRTLGRTGAIVSIVGLGLDPLGLGGFSQAEIRAVAETAIEEGITYFDVQWDYGEAERHLAPVLKVHRSKVFLVAKISEQPRAKAIPAIRESLRRLGTDHLDGVLLNNIGDFDLKLLLTPDGVLAGLQQAQKDGFTRFLGICGHMRAAHFVESLKTGAFDIVMCPLNFVDRHTYEFETEVLPAAAQQNAGLVAMKVLGGSLKYDTRTQRSRLEPSDFEPALRYTLGLPGLSTALIGCKSIDEIRAAACAARGARLLSPGEMETLLTHGKRLAGEWASTTAPCELPRRPRGSRHRSGNQSRRASQ